MIYPPDYEFCLAQGPVLDGVEALVAAVHGDRAGRLTRSLALNHPTPSQVLAVVHKPTGDAVSTLSLIPWKWRIDEAVVDAWEVGIVATAEAHRSRGLSSALMAEAGRRMAEAGVDLGIIQGIPHYYRRFGYEHAFNLENHLDLEFRQLAPLAAGWSVRPAAEGDAGLLARFDQSLDAYQISSVRSPEVWRYRLTGASGTETEMEHLVVCDPTGLPRGYLAVTPRGFGEGLVVHEAGGDEVWPALAAAAAQAAVREGKPYLRLNLGPAHPFAVWARDRGAHDKGGWHWQVAVPDPARLLQTLAPTLGRRAREGAPRPWTLTLDGYGTKVHLAYDPQTGLSFPSTLEDPGTTVRIPPELWAKLALGWKSAARLREFYPDLHGWGDRPHDLMDVLFPVRQGFIQTNY